MSKALTRCQRIGLLCQSEPQALADLAMKCLDHSENEGLNLTVIHHPEVGSITMTVREPVECSRFHLTDVLVSRAEVEHRGVRAWAMVMGEELEAALAAAILDAEVEAQGPLTNEVRALCLDTQKAQDKAAEQEWQELEPTIVNFEEVL